ncbi:MAG: hypothetical protein ACN6PY_12705, partial [Paraburkholderia nemoris]
QEIVQFDVVAGEREIEVGHGVCTFRQRVRIISQKLALNEVRGVRRRRVSICKQMLCECQKVKRSVTTVVKHKLDS